MVVSATLTRDPSKLARLALVHPRFVAMAATGPQRYKLPEQLQERQVAVSGAQKPLALLALLEQLAGGKTLVFASSLDMTHK